MIDEAADFLRNSLALRADTLYISYIDPPRRKPI
jgi:hypothetical protein